jgi:hypothetical protein
MARGTMKTGFGKSKEKRSPMAPTMASGMPQGVVGGSPSARPERGTLRRKGGGQGGDLSGPAGHRQGLLEPQGPRMRIEIPLRYPQVREAAPTQANGKIIKSYPKLQDTWGGRQFWDASRGG